ncbi:MAG TPA: beta-N-acetylglucosaminidase domain-containing protein [Hanamia sp.]|jgi:hypothetical protein
MEKSKKPFVNSVVNNTKDNTKVVNANITSSMYKKRIGFMQCKYKWVSVIIAIIFSMNTVLAKNMQKEYGTYNTSATQSDSIYEIPNQLPKKKNSFIEKPNLGENPKGFSIRGTKGWSWTPEQYLAEIPVLAKYKMNFLMNCYLSMFSQPLPADSLFVSPITKKLNTKNEWWLPIPESKKKAYEKVFEKSREYGINFCFGIHPQLSSPRPADLSSEKDFEDIWQHYAWAQSKGVRWFSVPLDDISGVRINGKEHALFVNKILSRLREKDKDVQMVICPTYYYANPDNPKQKFYTEELAKYLDKDVYVFWTGKSVLPSIIKVADAEIYRKLVNHRIILWDNYPVNDASKTLHLAPLTGRDKNLSKVIDGYMANPFFTENEINRIPLFTQADYSYDPLNYNPETSITQAIIHQTDNKKQQQVLLELVKLYSSHINIKSVRYNPALDRYLGITAVPFSSYIADAYIEHLKTVQHNLKREFPGKYNATKKTLAETIHQIENNYHKKYD